MPYAQNTIAVNKAKIKNVECRYTTSNEAIVNVSVYEYQGKNKKTDEPEGIFWNLEIWGKTGEFFFNQSPSEGDYVSFIGSVIDKSFKGQDGKTQYRQSVRVNSIELLRAPSTQTPAF